MRKITFFLLVWFPSTIHAIFFYNQIPIAQIKAARESKLLVVQFSAKWCAPCQIMEENTWPHPDVVNYCDSNCVISKIDIEHPEGKDYALKYGIKSVPTTLVFNVKGDEVGRYENSFSASRLISFLQLYDTPENRTFNSSSPNLQDYLTQLSERDNLKVQTAIEGRELIQLGHEQESFEVPANANIPLTERLEVAHGKEHEKSEIPTFALMPILNTLEEEEINSNLHESIVYAKSVNTPKQPTTHLTAPPVLKNKREATNTTPQNSTKAMTSNRFGVQTGAYTSKESASKALQNIQDQHHLDGTILPPNDINDPYYRVIIGDYGDKSDADKIAGYLRKNGNEAWSRMY